MRPCGRVKDECRTQNAFAFDSPGLHLQHSAFSPPPGKATLDSQRAPHLHKMPVEPFKSMALMTLVTLKLRDKPKVGLSVVAEFGESN